MKAKIKSLLTGEVVEVRSTIDHPDSLNKFAVWVDDENNSYGQCHIGVPLGYELLEVTPDFHFGSRPIQLRSLHKGVSN